MVAILLAGGVLLGTGALVVDIGRIYAERQNLLSGADAGAMAAAKACAGDPTCTSDVTALAATAKSEADRSVTDGAPDATVLCGQKSGQQFGSSCNTTATNLTGCVGSRPGTSGLDYVEIATTTRTDDGKTVLPPVFAETLVGQGYHGATVGACSRVSWGSVGTMPNVLPLMISKCAWAKATNNGSSSSYAPLPGPGWAPPDTQRVDLYADGPTMGCPQDTQGSLAALVGWSDLTCAQQLSVGDRPFGVGLTGLGSLLGAVLALPCGLQKFIAWLGGVLQKIQGHSATPDVFYLPVYDTPDNSCLPILGLLGLNMCSYHILGFAAVELTGGTNGILSAPQISPDFHQCWDGLALPLLNQKVPCFTGYFTRKGIFGKPGAIDDFGLTAFQQTG